MYSYNAYPQLPGSNKVNQQKFVKRYAPGANKGKKSYLSLKMILKAIELGLF